MEKEESCDTALSLSLGIFQPVKNPGLRLPNRPLETSITLTLLKEIHSSTEKKETCRLSSPHSTISSFSTNIAKREYLEPAAGEEGEVERGSFSRGSEEEEEASAARKKLRLSKEQSALLEDRFKEHATLNPKQKQALAKHLNLRPRQIEVWFQNRRARTKLKQTEVDCDLLRRCCETLTEENRRLQKELHELKALKFSGASTAMPPLFMHLPAATLTVCPSCERIAGTGTSGANKSQPTKQHFCNPFARSAAC